MKTYVVNHPEKGRIEYTDKKRWLWAAALVFQGLPLLAMWVFMSTENPWVLFIPLVFAYGITPLADHFLGVDKTNPPEEIVSLLDQDPFYRGLVIATIPIIFTVVVAGAWLVGNYSLSWPIVIAVALMVGLYSGQTINIAHEIGHKNGKLEQLIARFTLSITGYGHFCIEHNMGHHRQVATPEDVASSRMGESIYAFALRELPGAAVRGWAEERKRLERRRLGFWSVQNHILQSYALTLLYQGALVLAFGLPVLVFFIIHNAVAWFQLTSANYIEHYGLLREKLPNGKYEPCKPHHSWNANHIFSNILLFQLERHSDHHANSLRPYQSLRSFENLPELPSGYFFMYFLAYFPPLWYAVMDKRLLNVPHISGDLDKVNIAPSQEARLKEKWGGDAWAAA